MKKTIYFLRTAPYDYLLEGKNLYQSFNAVAKLQTEPDIKSISKTFLLKNSPKEIFKAQEIFCSPRKRSIQTANLISSDHQIVDNLIEVRFQMEDFITEEDFYDKKGNPNVQKARKAFVQALINNHLQESFANVLNRIEELLNFFREEPTREVLVFSHGFFMKIIEAYIKNPHIKNDPHALLEYFDGNTETFKFCEGFIVEFDDKNFQFKSYIRNKEEYGH